MGKGRALYNGSAPLYLISILCGINSPFRRIVSINTIFSSTLVIRDKGSHHALLSMEFVTVSFFRISNIVGIVCLLSNISSASAQTCKERFILAATEGNGVGNYRQIVTQKIKGGQGDTVHEFIMSGHHHWLTKPIEPKGIGWTLLYDGAMYSSLDEGSTWRKINQFDQKLADAAREKQKRDVEGVTELDCGTDEIEGKTYDRVHGQYKVVEGFKSTQVHTYWINSATGLIVRSKYETISPSFQSTVSQKMIPFGDAELPTP